MKICKDHIIIKTIHKLLLSMGLEVDTPIFKWLQNLGIVKDGRRTPDNKVQLPDDIMMKMFDGIIIGSIIKQIIKLHPQQNSFEKLDAMKQNSTPAIRLYNWNILTQLLKKLGMTIQYAQKSKILNLQPLPLQKVIQHLHGLYATQAPPQQPKPLQVDITQVSKKKLQDATNILQFFVISISRNFKLSPQHTLNLFLDNNKYLAHLLVKGVKNSYDPIYGLFNDIQANIDYIILTLFCTDEQQSVNFFFSAIKPALISKQQKVSEKCIQILEKVHETYQLNSMSLEICKNWMKQQGLNTIFFAIKRHINLIERIINITFLFIGEEFFKNLQPVDKSVLWENEGQKISFLLTFFYSLPVESIQQFSRTKQYAQWIKLILKIMKKSKEPNTILPLISVMSWLWQNLQQQFQTNENGLPNAFLAFLKNCSLNQSQVVFIKSIQTMFSLMQSLGNKKNNNAPFFYKILVNCFQFSGISDRVSFMAVNFKNAYQNIKNLPGGPMVDPLIKNIQKQASWDCINLCRTLIQQNRVTEDQLVELIEILTSLIFYDIDVGTLSLEIIFDNLNVMNDEMFDQYLQKNSKNGLAYFYSISNSIKRKHKDLKSDFQRYGKSDQMKKGANSFTEQMKKHIVLGHLVKFLQKCIQQSENVRQMLQPLLFHTYIRIRNELKKAEQAELLIPLMKYYYPAQDELQTKIKQFQDELKPPDQQKPQQKSILQNNSIIMKNNSMMHKSSKASEMLTTPKVLDSSMFHPSSYAMKDLQKLKKKIQLNRSQEQERSKQKDLMQSKKQLFRSVLNEKRLVKFGVKSAHDLQYKCIYDWDTAKQDNPNSVYGIPDIKLLNLAVDEQTAFMQDVDSVIKKYRKLWRFLFFKYSTFGAKQKQQFKSQQKINIAQVWKMLKEYDLMILKKEESHAIIRLINEAMKRKNDLQNLTYLGFQEYIFQMCNYGYNKIGCGHVPPGQKIIMMVKQIRAVTASKGGNVDLFDNPEQVYFQETEVIREFNKRLKEDPEYILPQGYKKIKMQELQYNHEVHPVNIQGISTVYTQVLEVLDEILSGCPALGFHVLQPLTHKTQKCIAKPALFQEMNEKVKDKKGYLQPKNIPTTADIKSRQKISSFKNEYHPHINFSLGIKLGLAGVSIKNRFIADQVAYWMDDMLDAIQKGSLKVQNKAKKKIDNQAIKKKRASMHKMKLEQKQYEKKWQKRAESVKAEKEVNKQKKKEKDKQRKQEWRKRRIAQKQKKQRQIKKKQEKFKKTKAQLQQKRKDEQDKRRKEMQQKKKTKQQYKKGVQEYFRKKKQQLQEKQMNMRKIKEDQKNKEIETKQKQVQFAKKLHYSILKKQESVLQKIEDLKKGYDDVWTSKQIQDAFINFENQLKYLFDLLLKHEKSKISATNHDELSLNTLHFFTLKFKIVPFMIQKNTLAKIFKGVGRTNEAHSGVDFQGFKQVLFRISVKSKDMLNQIIQVKKQKKRQMEKFLSKQSSDGNHFDVNQDQQAESPSRVNSTFSPKKKETLTQDYLYNTEGVTGQTVQQMLKFLNLPKDRLGVQQRYKQVIQDKTVKPRNILIRELKNSLE